MKIFFKTSWIESSNGIYKSSYNNLKNNGYPYIIFCSIHIQNWTQNNYPNHIQTWTCMNFWYPDCWGFIYLIGIHSSNIIIYIYIPISIPNSKSNFFLLSFIQSRTESNQILSVQPIHSIWYSFKFGWNYHPYSKCCS